jgi:hypothetical protein
MTWYGKPEGVVRLYLDGVLAGEHTYDDSYNDNRSQPRNIAVGMRPPSWAGRDRGRGRWDCLRFTTGFEYVG